LETLRGTVRRITFCSEDFFVIAKATIKGLDDELVTIKGPLANVSEWDDVELKGSWTHHPKYGKQFDFKEGQVLLPCDEKGIFRFLCDRLPMVGERRAKAILDRFGRGDAGVEGVWTVLSEHAERLTEIRGITAEDAERIREDYQAVAELRDHEVWLKSMGVGPARAVKILAKFRAQTKQVLSEDPYILMDLDGFGFATTDDIAKHIGVPDNHPGRARAALLHILQEAAEGEGHTYLPKSEVLRLSDELGVPRELVLEVAEFLAGREEKVVMGEAWPGAQSDDPAIGLVSLYRAEKAITDDLVTRLIGKRGVEVPAIEVPEDSRAVSFDREKRLEKRRRVAKQEEQVSEPLNIIDDLDELKSFLNSFDQEAV
jgi:exodeoxyribonuclease V alpha subunit